MSGPFSPSSWKSVARLTDIFLRDGGREGGSWGGGWATNPRAADRKEKVKKTSMMALKQCLYNFGQKGTWWTFNNYL